MVKCFALVTEVALSSMGLDWVGCSKGVRFSMVWIWLVFQGRVIFKGLDWLVFQGRVFFKGLDWMVFMASVFSAILDSGGFFQG
jgi:hypothetical protein